MQPQLAPSGGLQPRRNYDAAEQRLIQRGLSLAAKARWQARWDAAGRPRSWINPRNP